MDKLSGKISAIQTITGFLSAQASIQGSLTVPRYVGAETYDGPYEVTPKSFVAEVLSTRNKLMNDDVTVLKIPTYETSNEYGKTFIIGDE